MVTSFIEVAPAVWKIQMGHPEEFTPLTVILPKPATERMSALPQVGCCPIKPERVVCHKTRRGFQVHIPLEKEENIYGLGLQLLSFNQKGLKKTLRVNSDPRVDLGDSHAPVPFYVTTGGYGVLVDTGRYASFYCGSAVPVAKPGEKSQGSPVSENKSTVTLGVEEVYSKRDSDLGREMVVDIPGVDGVTVYFFGGPSLLGALQRYNLFSGGGCVPPRWALGVWYRGRSDFDQDQVVKFTQEMREERMPCDVFGLEPGWQSHAYSCSHVWSKEFPDPAGLVSELQRKHFQTNLWTHAFTHESSPIYKPLLPHSGDITSFGGIVPDFLQEEARAIFADHYRRSTAALGVSGYKLDECDNSDFILNPWSFPEWSRFPSGVDGELMHSFFGVLFQSMMHQLYERDHRRTFGLVRCSHALATPFPFALYSDLYDFRQFVRGILSASFSGLLWCPEIREASSGLDLLRRLQGAVVSPIVQINAWYIKNPPWKQWNVPKNNNDEFLSDASELQEKCRSILELRMSLVPYIHTAFYRYWKEGIPPFRALVTDYPSEAKSWGRDDQILIGDRLMAAPFIDGTGRRLIWIPPGSWADFWTGKTVQGGSITELYEEGQNLPIFVKSGSVLPLATPTLHTRDPESYRLAVHIYGDGSIPFALFEEADSDVSFDEDRTDEIVLSWDNDCKEVRVGRKETKFSSRYSISTVVMHQTDQPSDLSTPGK